MKKTKAWTSARHKVIGNLARFLLMPWSKRKYNIEITPCKEAKGRQMLILFNHQTAHDQFFVADAFGMPIYFIASEDIFSLGFLSTLLRWAVAPIPIKKQATDVKALKTCLKVIKEGGSIALAPEGNRTYSGRLCEIKPTIASMARRFKLPIACFRIEGGYGVHPRWADDVRSGKMRAYTSRIIEPEEYKDWSEEKLLSEILEELDVREDNASGEYKGKTLAEYLERAMYVCPDCGLTEFRSEGDEFTCTKCGRRARYLSTKKLEGIDREFPFEYMYDWYDYQCKYVNNLDLLARENEIFYNDIIDAYRVIPYRKKELIKKGVTSTLRGGSIELRADDFEKIWNFGETSAVTVLGKNKINVYSKDGVYQLKGGARFNALKYVNFYNRYRNIKEGRKNEQFLGL